MLIGYNHRLEYAIHTAKAAGKVNKEKFGEIIHGIEECVLAGDIWHLVAEYGENTGSEAEKAYTEQKKNEETIETEDEDNQDKGKDDEEKKDESAASDSDSSSDKKKTGPIGGLDFISGYTFVDDNGKRVMLAYTSEEQVPAEYRPSLMLDIKAKRILKALCSDEGIEGIWINPRGDMFYLEREMAAVILLHANTVPNSEIMNKLRYDVEPKTILDIGRILASWSAGWKEDGNMEKWSLRGYPIMADGTFLIILEMESAVHEGKLSGDFRVSHTNMYYRVYHCELLPADEYDGDEEDELLDSEYDDYVIRVINRYRFVFQDGKLNTCFIRDGKLFAAMSTRFENTDCSVLQLYPNDDSVQYTIFSDIETVLAKSDGTIAVAYHSTMWNVDKAPIIFFDSAGEIDDIYHNKSTLGCKDINLDCDENLWAYMHPAMAINLFDAEDESVREFPVSLQGFNCFGFSRNMQRLIVTFSEREDDIMIYVMRRDEKGGFIDPVQFNFEPVGWNGLPMRIKKCNHYGCPSMMKDKMILRADDRLYFYDLNDFCDDTRV